ncbi:MAG: response regulator transcription factor [Chloroflexi bacterium]|nr:response regulator transcription factor [Chloroflexota bacterium]
MPPIRVLVVDDHSIVRQGVHALLSMAPDLEVIGEATNGREAIEMVAKLAPDVVIMDIAMPQMDGLEATRRIHKRYPGVKVVILTQHVNQEYTLSIIKAGAAGCLPKHALATDLISAVQTVHKGDSFLYPSMATAVFEDLQARDNDFETLTDREREILKLIAEDYSSEEIAKMLMISAKTVRAHRAAIIEKLNIRGHGALVKYAIRKGLTNLDT